MVKPVNRHILVEVVEQDSYIKRKSGIVIPTEGSENQSGPVLIVAALPDATLNFDVSVGDRIQPWDGRILFFRGEDDKKYALIKEENVAGVEKL